MQSTHGEQAGLCTSISRKCENMTLLWRKESDKMNAEKLNEIKERAEKATSGPWRIAFGANYELAVRELDGDKFIADIDYESTNDAAFIAHAREDIPALIAEVERLQNEVKAKFHAGYADGKRDARKIQELTANG